VCLADAFYHAIFRFDCGWNLRAPLSLRAGLRRKEVGFSAWARSFTKKQ
jgi:hypothetical protein